MTVKLHTSFPTVIPVIRGFSFQTDSTRPLIQPVPGSEPSSVASKGTYSEITSHSKGKGCERPIRRPVCVCHDPSITQPSGGSFLSFKGNWTEPKRWYAVTPNTSEKLLPDGRCWAWCQLVPVLSERKGTPRSH